MYSYLNCKIRDRRDMYSTFSNFHMYALYRKKSSNNQRTYNSAQLASTFTHPLDRIAAISQASPSPEISLVSQAQNEVR